MRPRTHIHAMSMQLAPRSGQAFQTYLGVAGASRSSIVIFLLFLLQGLPGIPGKRGEMGRPVKIFRVYYADSTGRPTSCWLYCTGGPRDLGSVSALWV